MWDESDSDGDVITDPTGSVSVAIDPGSRRISGLRLSVRWRERVGAGQVGSAIVATIRIATAALRTGITASSTATAGGSADEDGPGRSAPDPSERTREAARHDAELRTEALLETARQLDREHAARHRDYTGSDDRRHATFTLGLDDQPIGLDLDAEWLTGVGTDRLIETLQTALRRAYESVDTARRELDNVHHTDSEATRMLERTRTDPGARGEHLSGRYGEGTTI